MAWDHLWGNQGGDDPFPVDPATFLLAFGLILVAAAVVFGVTVPRAARGEGDSHRSALVHSVLAFLLAVPASWLGFPVVVAAGGIVLGLHARAGHHRGVATVAVIVGIFVVAFAVAATAFPPSDSD